MTSNATSIPASSTPSVAPATSSRSAIPSDLRFLNLTKDHLVTATCKRPTSTERPDDWSQTYDLWRRPGSCTVLSPRAKEWANQISAHVSYLSQKSDVIEEFFTTPRLQSKHENAILGEWLSGLRKATKHFEKYSNDEIEFRAISDQVRSELEGAFDLVETLEPAPKQWNVGG